MTARHALAGMLGCVATVTLSLSAAGQVRIIQTNSAGDNVHVIDPATNTVVKGNNLFVVYIPFATEKSTGLSTQPSDNKPWLMLPGTPKAHIMFSMSM